MINIICLKWGTKYSSKYVNKLYDGVKKNVTLPFRFHCLTDDVVGIKKEIETSNFLDLPDYDVGKFTHWKKLAIFNKTLSNLKGMALFLDLDTVITGNIDCFIEYAFKNQNRICMLKLEVEKSKSSGRLLGTASSAIISLKIGKIFEYYFRSISRILKQYIMSFIMNKPSFRVHTKIKLPFGQMDGVGI